MSLDRQVAELRSFNRFWTARIGVLGPRLLETPFSPAEARVVYELAQRASAEPHELRRELGLDAGYLSRIVHRLERDGIVTLARSRTDRRKQIVALTAKGRRAFDLLDRRSRDECRALLGACSPEAQDRVVAAMAEIRGAFEPPAKGAYVLRPPRAGELGWVVQRHGALYAREYGWSDEFEALVARIVGEYVANRDPAREAAWIAELAGRPVGSVFCVARSARVAQLRLLLVEPEARGHGIGRRLVDECLAFARDRGYREIMLWTNDVLRAARRIYEAAGFELVHEAPHTSFGKRLREQTWSLKLR